MQHHAFQLSLLQRQLRIFQQQQSSSGANDLVDALSSSVERCNLWSANPPAADRSYIRLAPGVTIWISPAATIALGPFACLGDWRRRLRSALHRIVAAIRLSISQSSASSTRNLAAGVNTQDTDRRVAQEAAVGERCCVVWCIPSVASTTHHCACIGQHPCPKPCLPHTRLATR